MVFGYAASFLFIVCLCIGIYLFGYAARKADALYVISLEVILGCLLLTPLILLTDKISFLELFTKPEKEEWLWLSLAGILVFIGGNFFTLMNLKSAGERINSLLSPAITATVIIAAVLFFGETLNLLKAIGIIITLTAITFFLISATKKNYEIKHPQLALWSSAATVICITLTIICSIRGTIHSHLPIMHSIWLRIITVLPIIIFILFTKKKVWHSKLPVKFYLSILGGIIIQTIIANYLWFYSTYKIGISTFQVIIATLPFFVYAADVYLLKRTKPSLYFLLTALLAAAGIGLLML